MIITKDIFNVLHDHAPFATIIEAGAFDGRDTKKLSTLFPEAKIHSFEPVPEIFQALVAQTQECANVYRYPLALSTMNGTQEFFRAKNPKKPTKLCQAGTLLRPKDRLHRSPIIYPDTIQVPTITLAEWAKSTGITQIDFVWLDLQGHELAVLKSAGELIKTINLIYIEVNFIEAYHDQPSYAQVDTWLKSQGFEPIMRDFQNENEWFFGALLYKKKSINSI